MDGVGYSCIGPAALARVLKRVRSPASKDAAVVLRCHCREQQPHRLMSLGTAKACRLRFLLPGQSNAWVVSPAGELEYQVEI